MQGLRRKADDIPAQPLLLFLYAKEGNKGQNKGQKGLEKGRKGRANNWAGCQRAAGSQGRDGSDED